MTNFEESVIGSILLTNGQALDRIMLSPDDFALPVNAVIFRTMLEMKTAGQAIDVITLGMKYPKLNSYLHDCMTSTPTPNSVEFYAGKVLEESTRKRVIAAGTQMAVKATGDNLEAAIDQAKREIDGLLERNTATKVSYVDDELIPYLDVVDKPRTFSMSPWSQLNDLTNGFRPGALYIIGARPGVGKTVVGLQLAWEMSKTGAVSFHSLEMGKTELFNRIIAQQASIYLGNIEKRTVREHEWVKIAQTLKAENHRLAIHDKSGQTVHQIRAQARAVKDQGDLKAIVVDYLGLIQDTEKGRKRYESVTDISIALKNLARDLEVPVIALAQLNRGPEQRKDAEPDMADLRDSGGIEQDADVVILLHRVAAEHDTEPWQKSQMIMNVAKNRHGQTGRFGLVFEGEHARVTEAVN